MGGIKSKSKHLFKKKLNKYDLIIDHYDSYLDLEKALRNVGLESCQLIIGIDYTKSNQWKGGPPYYHYQNLHAIDPDRPNIYQQVLTIMCNSLSGFDDDQLIDTFGFGDSVTTNKSVFSFYTTTDKGIVSDQPCYGLGGVLTRYNELTPYIKMAGPTNFAPIIRKAIDIVRLRKAYHILIIITDGDVDDVSETIDAIVSASKYSLSIVCIGVGSGPWQKMIKFDDQIPGRKFDNFQFVDFYKTMSECENHEIKFATNVLMEIPKQYEYIKKKILSKFS